MLDSNILLEEKQQQSTDPIPNLLLTENNAQILRRHRRQAAVWQHVMGSGPSSATRVFCEKSEERKIGIFEKLNTFQAIHL